MGSNPTENPKLNRAPRRRSDVGGLAEPLVGYPTACPGDGGEKAVKPQLPTLILKQTQAQHWVQSTEAKWELLSNNTVRSLGNIPLALTIHLRALSASSLPR